MQNCSSAISLRNAPLQGFEADDVLICWTRSSDRVFLQDWNYLAGDCMELTLELSLNKWPPAAMLPSIWEDNKLALINLPLTAIFGGLR